MKLLRRLVKKYNERKLKGGKDFRDDGYLFSYADGEPVGVNSLTSKYNNFMKKHTDEIRFLSLHKLRHSYASICIADGMDIKSVQETLGHSDAKVTLNTYAHGYESKKQHQADFLEHEIFRKVI